MIQANAIHSVVQNYVDRGQFRHMSEQKNGRSYEFVWLNDTTMRLTWDPRSSTLQFRDVLPDVRPRSPLQKALRSFLAGRFDPQVPEHRRLDPERVTLVCTTRKSSMTVGLKLADPEDEYGPRKLVNLIHEMFVYLNQSWPDYMHESFNLPME